MARRQRIGLVSPFFPPFEGGAERVAARVATTLVQRGHTVEVHTLQHHPELRESEEVSGVQVFRHPYAPRRLLSFTTVKSPSLVTAVSHLNTDLVHIHNTTYPLLLIEAAAQLKHRGIPTMLVPHGIFEAVAGGHKGIASTIYGPVIAAAMRRLFRNVDSVGLLSNHDLAVLASIGIRPTHYAVLSNGVDVPNLDASWPREQAASPLRLLHVANLKPNKGHFNVLHALELLGPNRSVVYEIVGSGGETWAAYEQDVRRAVEAFGLHRSVVFHGRVSDVDRDRLYRRADVVVVPSLAETFPLSVLEGMSYAKPVVASRVGGVEDMIEDGRSGIIVPPGSPRAIVDAIMRLHDAETRRQIGNRARQRVQRTFAWDAVVDRYESLSEEVSTGSSNTAATRRVLSGSDSQRTL